MDYGYTSLWFYSDFLLDDNDESDDDWQRFFSDGEWTIGLG